MAYKFNPFTGKLDETGAGGATAAGSANEIQYNDGAGGLAASSDFTVDPDWNDAAVTFTGLKLNVTNTASASGSKLLDLQSGGTSIARVSITGRITATNYLEGTGLTLGATGLWQPINGNLTLLDTAILGWSSTTNVNSGQPGDVQLRRDAANTLAQRNGTNAQTFRVYNTLTGSDVSATGNYERGFLQWNSNVFEIGTEAGSGGGSEQPVRITAATLKLPNLPTYANNGDAAAVLAVGDVYKTATGELRIVV